MSALAFSTGDVGGSVELLTTTFRLTVGGAFALAGVMKLRDRHGFAIALERFGIKGRRGGGSLVTVLPVLELVIGVAMVLAVLLVTAAAAPARRRRPPGTRSLRRPADMRPPQPR
jgi:uncharacterized membrane protein YphA (DoxX/SURF4 family)